MKLRIVLIAAALIPSLFFADLKAAAMKEVRVSTARELVEAIAPDRKIIITCHKLQIGDLKKFNSPYVSVDQDNIYALKIYNVNNLIITSEQESHLVTSNTSAYVLYFYNCRDTEISRLVLGHEPEGFCIGGVLKYEKCKNINVTRCRLYGCGTVGAEIIKCDKIMLYQTVIEKCTSDLLHMDECSDIRLVSCHIREIKGEEYLGSFGHKAVMSFSNCRSVEFSNCSIYQNNVPDNNPIDIINISGDTFGENNKVRFIRCLFKDNNIISFHNMNVRKYLLFINPIFINNGFKVTGLPE